MFACYRFCDDQLFRIPSYATISQYGTVGTRESRTHIYRARRRLCARKCHVGVNVEKAELFSWNKRAPCEASIITCVTQTLERLSEWRMFLVCDIKLSLLETVDICSYIWSTGKGFCWCFVIISWTVPIRGSLRAGCTSDAIYWVKTFYWGKTWMLISLGDI